MKIRVRVKTKANKELVEKAGEGQYLVFTKAKPEKGRANQAVIKLLAKYFKRPLSCFKIVRGLRAKQKIIKIK